MICLNCKKQIPDDSARCPECNTEVFHKEQIKKEISFRRYQRWFFYGVIILLFSGMTAFIVKIYLDNAKLLVDMSMAQKTLVSKSTELETAKTELGKKIYELDDIKSTVNEEKEKLAGNLNAAEKELDAKINELSKTIDEKMLALAGYERVNSAFLNISEVAAGIVNNDLKKIPVADVWPISPDTDKDGIPDVAEVALQTSPTSADTDGDGFSDKDEIAKNFNPLGEGNMPIDQSFADKQKGKVFKQVWGGGYLWYVGQDGKRYFLSPIEETKPIVPIIENTTTTTPPVL